MNDEGGLFFESSDDSNLIWKFEQMRSKGDCYFFDIEEFESLIDHYFINKNTGLAMELIDLAKSQHPFSLDISIKEAEILAFTDRPEEALASLERVELVEKNNHEVLITKANIYSQLGQHLKAVDILKQAVNFSEADEKDEILLKIAFEYQNANNMHQAIHFIEKALYQNPKNTDALYELAYCCEVTEKFPTLISTLKDQIDEHPYNADAWFLLGNAYAAVNNDIEAVNCYDFATAIRENFVSAYFNRANIYVKMELYEKAIENYLEVKESELTLAVVNYYIGDCYLQLDEYETAIEYFRKTIAEDDEFADAWYGMAYSLLSLEKYTQAISYFKKAIALVEDCGMYWHGLAEAYFNLGEDEKCLDAFYKSSIYDEENVDFHLDYSQALLENGQKSEAKEVLHTAMSKVEEKDELLYRIAGLYLVDNNVTDALEYLEKALIIAPKNYRRLFEYFPMASEISEVLDLIEDYTKE